MVGQDIASRLCSLQNKTSQILYTSQVAIFFFQMPPLREAVEGKATEI